MTLKYRVAAHHHRLSSLSLSCTHRPITSEINFQFKSLVALKFIITFFGDNYPRSPFDRTHNECVECMNSDSDQMHDFDGASGRIFHKDQTDGHSSAQKVPLTVEG
jgi:hypothetical protein